MKTREIKFRVYCTFRKQMITVGVDSNASFNHDGTISTHGVLGSNPLMQYTGLKDKNGVEIYEGDIITFDGVTSSGNVIKREVTYNSEYCRFQGGMYPLVEGKFCTPPRVIGNIYQNPEML